MSSDTYFLLTICKSYYPFAPLPQLTSQKSQFQKLKQPQWFPIKTEIIGKIDSLQSEGVFLEHIAERGQGDFPMLSKYFDIFQIEIGQIFSQQQPFIFSQFLNASLNRNAVYCPALPSLQLMGWHWTHLLVVTSSSLYASQETAASCHFSQRTHGHTLQRLSQEKIILPVGAEKNWGHLLLVVEAQSQKMLIRSSKHFFLNRYVQSQVQLQLF